MRTPGLSGTAEHRGRRRRARGNASGTDRWRSANARGRRAELAGARAITRRAGWGRRARSKNKTACHNQASDAKELRETGERVSEAAETPTGDCEGRWRGGVRGTETGQGTLEVERRLETRDSRGRRSIAHKRQGHEGCAVGSGQNGASKTGSWGRSRRRGQSLSWARLYILDARRSIER